MHGILILSIDHGRAWVWLPGEKQPALETRVVVTGSNLAIFEKANHGRHRAFFSTIFLGPKCTGTSCCLRGWRGRTRRRRLTYCSTARTYRVSKLCMMAKPLKLITVGIGRFGCYDERRRFGLVKVPQKTALRFHNCWVAEIPHLLVKWEFYSQN